MQSIFSIGTSSASHTYGNICALIREMILSKFERGLFNTVNMSTDTPFKSIDDLNESNTIDNMKKKIKPLLSINPTFKVQEDGFLVDTQITKNMDNLENGISASSVTKFISDKERAYSLGYKLNRDRFDFEITAQFPSRHMQIDVYKNMLNNMLWDRPFFMPASLESMIPRTIVHYMSLMSGFDISNNDSKHNTPLLLRYMNSISKYPITYKVRNSTALDEFFLYYNSKLLVKFTDLDLSQGNKKGMVDDRFDITFRIEVEFNLPGNYILIGDPEKYRYIDFALISTNIQKSKYDIIPVFTIGNDYKNPEYVNSGYEQYASSIMNIDPDNNGEDDICDLSPLFIEEHLYLIKQMMGIGVPISSLFKLEVIKNTVRILETDFTMDWNTMSITIHNSDIYSSYRVYIYANMIQVNQKLLDINEKERIDKTKI